MTEESKDKTKAEILLKVLNKYDYLFSVDIEHTGPNTAATNKDTGPNQIETIGLAMIDVKAGKIVDTFRTPHIHLSPGSTWHQKTLKWWLSIHRMKEIKESIVDVQAGTVSLEQAMALTIQQCRTWQSSITPGKRCTFLTDTVMGDAPHLMAACNKIGEELPFLCDSENWTDFVHLENIKNMSIALADNPHHLIKSCPKNPHPHDARWDAIHIAEQYLHYRNAALVFLSLL